MATGEGGRHVRALTGPGLRRQVPDQPAHQRRSEAPAKGVGLSLTMTGLAEVRIHPSQFPEAVQSDLLESLRSRKINHKFHYDSVKQTQKWLALHEACSPARTEPDC